MRFFTNKKFLFKLIVSVCLCLTIFNFGINTVVHALPQESNFKAFKNYDSLEGHDHSDGGKVTFYDGKAILRYNDNCQVIYYFTGNNVTGSDFLEKDESGNNSNEITESSGSRTGTSGTSDEEEGSLVSTVGGKLLDPICDLLLVIGDGVMGIIQKAVMGTEATAIYDNRKASWWGKVAAAIAIVVAIVVACVVIPEAGAWLAGMAGKIAPFLIKAAIIGTAANIVTNGAVTAAVTSLSAVHFGDYVVLPTFTIGPEEIFSGDILLFDANVFNTKEVITEEEDGETKYYIEKNGEKVPTSINNSASELKDTISKWYYAIRNIALIGLMIILIYVGIKILMTSIAADKAKYKQMFGDWVVALCLVFLMQYIMVFANSFVESVIQVFVSVTDNKTNIVAITKPSEKLKDAIVELEGETGEELYVEGDPDFIQWPTNLMGRFRIAAQNHDGTAEYVGYTICYIILVMFTAFFAFTYIRRLLYLLFFTIIAPLVAFSYPLDKIRDGQAQAFNMWFREYLFNLLIQPFHLLLYTVFIGMAFDLAGTNIIYSLVVIGFMIPAEKFLRSMFGFNKATTPGFLAGPAGAAMTISAMKSLSSFAGKGGNKGKGGNNSSSSDPKEGKVRTKDSEYSNDKILQDAFADGGDPPAGNDPQLPPEQPPEQPPQLENPEGFFEMGYDDPSYQQGNNGEDSGANDAGDFQEENPLLIEPVNTEGHELDQYGFGLEEAEPEEDEQEEPKENVINGLKGYAKARLSNFANRTFNAKTITGFAKGSASAAVRYGLGATGAAIGVAAGIASGSPGDALKYGTAGAYAGSSIGSGAVNRAAGIYEKEKQLHEEALKTQYGEENWEQIQNKKLDDKFMKDKEKRQQYAQHFNVKKKQDIDKIMSQAVEYRKRGVTDDKIIMKAMDIDPTDRTNNKSIAAAVLAPGASTLKDLDTTMKRLGKVPGSQAHLADMERRLKKINGLKI